MASDDIPVVCVSLAREGFSLIRNLIRINFHLDDDEIEHFIFILAGALQFLPEKENAFACQITINKLTAVLDALALKIPAAHLCLLHAHLDTLRGVSVANK
jgi:hypothetical protein